MHEKEQNVFPNKNFQNVRIFFFQIELKTLLRLVHMGIWWQRMIFCCLVWPRVALCGLRWHFVASYGSRIFSLFFLRFKIKNPFPNARFDKHFTTKKPIS